MILSLSLRRRLVHEMERAAGSLASLAFYDGVMPATCDAAADGARIQAEPLPAQFFDHVSYGEEPALPQGARYWRVLSNEGVVVLQGDNAES
jgi:hypothetical protein